MQDLVGHTTSVGSLLSGDFFFRVPEYQRPFSWDDDNFDDLISDLVNASQEQEYFLGTLVLHNRADLGHYDIVDGQQRLTSIMILLACLRDLVESESYKKPLREKIEQPETVVDGIPKKVRLEVKDRQIFAEMVVDDDGTVDMQYEGLPEPEIRYVNAATIFRKKLLGFGQPDIEKLITFVNQKCVVIYLSTTSFDDAFRLFTIVNDRGKQLRRIDVLKAMNIAPDVITSGTVRDRVAQQWEDYEKELGESTFEQVFHLVRLALLRDKPQGDLLKEFEDRVFAKGVVAKGEPFLNMMFDYAKLYRAIFDERDIIDEAGENYIQYRALMNIMDAEFRASEWRACLLSFAKKFGSEGFYRYMLAIEKLYLTHWVKGVRKDERYGDYSKVLGAIEDADVPHAAISAVPFDLDAIRAAVARTDLYSAGFAKYFLLRLELSTCEHDAVHEFSARSIEHVLPQNPAEEGYWADHHDLGAIKEYVNSIGNLVLLSKSKNSSARNFDFDKKKEKYLSTRVTDYPRSVQVLGYENWDRETIEGRTAEAQDLLLQDP
jgi:hypothetical protein